MHPVDRVVDERGGLVRHFDAQIGQTFGMKPPRQILESHTSRRLTLRGLHCQTQPHSEAKLIMPLAGEMFWVAVDLKRDSATFGAWRGFHLRAEVPEALFVPRGCGHGCLSLTDDVSLLIIADNDFSATSGVGIVWDDPDLAIDWPLDGNQPFLSDAHAAFPSFASFRQDIGGL